MGAPSLKLCVTQSQTIRSELAVQVRGAGEMAGEQLVELLGAKRLREIENLRHRAAERPDLTWLTITNRG